MVVANGPRRRHSLARSPRIAVCSQKATRPDLQALEIPCQIVDANASEILIPVDLRKDWSPHRHLTGAVFSAPSFRSRNHSSHASQWKVPAASCRNARQIRRRAFQRFSHRSISFCVNAMANRAIGFVEVPPLLMNQSNGQADLRAFSDSARNSKGPEGKALQLSA